MTVDESMMTRALALAVNGQGFVEPNPMVGAVVVDADGQIVGEGWHERFGHAHAEVNAFQKAEEKSRGGTLYVTLEPCCHHGKTPPCTDAVIRSGVTRVVVAMRDPFPQVDGGGIGRLKQAGIRVDVGLLQEQAEALNAPYLTRLRSQRPYIIAKWAMTLDGKIATATGDSKWISSEAAREHAHEVRGRVDAILIGAETLRKDNPLLIARPAGPRVATRIIATKSGSLPVDGQLLRSIGQAPIIVWTHSAHHSLKAWQNVGAEVIETSIFQKFLNILADRGSTNLLVEGGSHIHGLMFDAGVVDEVMIYLSPIIAGGNGPSPVAGTGVNRIADAHGFDFEIPREFDGTFLFRGRKKSPKSW